MATRITESLPAGAPRLETDRLVLRAWTAEDAAALCRILADWEVVAGFGSGPLYRLKRGSATALASISRIEARRAIARNRRHWAQHGHGLWALEERESGELVGHAGLLFHDDWTAEPTRLEVGWMLRRDDWGRGLATEAGTAALGHAFEALEAERVISITGPANVRSQRVMDRLGLSFSGRTRWKRQPVVWYGIDREEWRRQAAAPEAGHAHA